VLALGELERSIFFALHGFNLRGLNEVMIFLSGPLPWVPLLAFLVWRIHAQTRALRSTLLLIVLALALLAMVDTSTSYFFKNLVGRLRPCRMPELKASLAQFGQKCGGRWGFFSSHAANAAALAVFFLPFAALTPWQKRSVLLTVGLVSYSRIYLGVHLPLDILAGLLWGSALAVSWVAVARSALRARAASASTPRQ